MIAIIDYGSGNVSAIANIFRRRNVPHIVTGNPVEVETADRFILPGVGAFDPTMATLRQSGLLDCLNDQVVTKGKKVLGICVGMQLLAESSEEGTLPGLGWIKGCVRRIDASVLNAPPLLPHMGWNSVELLNAASLFAGVDAAHGFYFLHSYYFDAASSADVAASVSYGVKLPCAVESGNVFGVQFHPEKSHANGEQLFLNFAAH
jgi:imidazole glycerol-phosphate synthase subunit HisH